MFPRTLLLMLIPLTLAVSAGTARGDALDCQGGIVSEGDSRLDLLSKCGEPDARETHDEEITERMPDGSRRKLYVVVETWTYDFGPSRLQRIITLKNGAIARIRTGNYGHDRNATPGPRDCSEQVVSRGDRKNDVLAKCGEPSFKDVHEEMVSERIDGGTLRKRNLPVEEWTYNLGPNRFVRILTFKNGRLTDIRTGKYGY